jgi:trehalose 6-phosphate synthase
VEFLAVLVPSRGSIDHYRCHGEEILAMMDGINRRLGSDDWQPIRLVVEHNRVQALAGLASADVVLVNPIVDGMNLVAKEAALVSERDAVLILSKTAGSSVELGPYAMNVDPLDVMQTADALYSALTMETDARHRQAQELRASVMRNDLRRWLAALIADMERGRLRSDRDLARELALPQFTEHQTEEKSPELVLTSASGRGGEAHPRGTQTHAN